MSAPVSGHPRLEPGSRPPLQQMRVAIVTGGTGALGQALAEETRGRGVTVNAVLPSTMDTPANRAAKPDADRRAWIPVESVATAIAFLASDDAAHITGSLLTV